VPKKKAETAIKIRENNNQQKHTKHTHIRGQYRHGKKKNISCVEITKEIYSVLSMGCLPLQNNDPEKGELGHTYAHL